MNLWDKMNVNFRNTGLIFGLALLLFACEDPGTIGIDVDGENLDFKVAYKKFILPATLVNIDSIPTSNSGRILTGSYADPRFGFSKPTGYAQLIRRIAPSLDSTSVFDSLFLQLKYDYVHGTEVKAENTLKVHRLEKELDGFATYYTFSKLDYSESPIGEITFKYVLDDREEVVMDTVLRIPLSNTLGEEFFSKMLDDSDTTFKSFEGWLTYFKGIALVAGDDYQTITGFNARDNQSKMVLYYHFTNTNGELTNRTYDFEMVNALHSYSIEIDRTGTPISQISDPYIENTSTDGFIYVQSGAGLVAKIDFSQYIDFIDTIQSLIINRADLTLGKVELYPSYVVPSESLVFYLTDSTNRRILAEDGAFKTVQQDNPVIDPSDTRFPIQSEFIEDDELYSDPFSSFLQALFDGTVTETQILTFPSFTSNSKTLDRFVLNPDNIILEVYYSVADEPTGNN